MSKQDKANKESPTGLLPEDWEAIGEDKPADNAAGATNVAQATHQRLEKLFPDKMSDDEVEGLTDFIRERFNKDNRAAMWAVDTADGNFVALGGSPEAMSLLKACLDNAFAGKIERILRGNNRLLSAGLLSQLLPSNN